MEDTAGHHSASWVLCFPCTGLPSTASWEFVGGRGRGTPPRAQGDTGGRLPGSWWFYHVPPSLPSITHRCRCLSGSRSECNLKQWVGSSGERIHREFRIRKAHCKDGSLTLKGSDEKGCRRPGGAALPTQDAHWGRGQEEGAAGWVASPWPSAQIWNRAPRGALEEWAGLPAVRAGQVRLGLAWPPLL